MLFVGFDSNQNQNHLHLSHRLKASLCGQKNVIIKPLTDNSNRYLQWSYNRADRNDMKIIASRKKNRHLNLHKIKKIF